MYKGTGAKAATETLAMQTAGELWHHTSWWQREQVTRHPTCPEEAEGKWDTDTTSHRESNLAVGCRGAAVQAYKNKTKSTELNWEGIRIRSPNNQKRQECFFFVNFYFKYEWNWWVKSPLWLITSGDRIGLSRNGPLTDGHKNFSAKLDWTRVAL